MQLMENAGRILPADRLKGWLPSHLNLSPELPTVTWFEPGSAEFSEPFFHQTVKRVTADGRERTVETGIDELLLLGRKVETIKPSGFIYHVSRCGSTLVANSLKALDDTIVISEAQPIAAAAWLYFAEAPPGAAAELMRGAVLRSIVRVLGQKRWGTERRYFIKLANWEIIFQGQFRRIWPDVPWIFLFRDPVEVLVSNLLKSGAWSRTDENLNQSAILADCTNEELLKMTQEDFYARVVGRALMAAVSHETPNSLFLDYKDLSFDRMVQVARFFGIEPTENELQQIHESTGIYSKDPSKKQGFSFDSSSKQASASEAVRSAAARWASSPYKVASEIAREHLKTRI